MASTNKKTAAAASDVSFRRTWDKEEFGERARKKLDGNDDDEASVSTELPKPTALLEARKEKIEFKSRIGTTTVVTKGSSLEQGGGFYCDVCDCLMKSSIGWLDHINGRKHQRNQGMTMQVERSTLDQVKQKFASSKRKKVDENVYDFEARLNASRDAEEASKRARIERKKDKKRQEEQANDDDDDIPPVDPELAALMGFGGFGSSKK